MENKQKPFVSALLVTRNEQAYVKNAMFSLINQTYPKDRYEIVVVDGESTDSTLPIVERIAQQNKKKGLAIRVLHNPKHILSSGWNIGLKEAKGEYVVRIDAHAQAAADFIEKNVETMRAVPDAVCVGGRLCTKSLNQGGEIIANVLSSPFGVGNSSFRVSGKAGYADTAVYGLYRKKVLLDAGGFHEKYKRNQDLELHARIKKQEGRFYYNPDIQCVYYARNTVGSMVKQAFGNGAWNMVLLKERKSALSVRHLVPFAFVVFLLAAAIGGFVNRKIWTAGAMVLLLHIMCGLYAASKKTRRGKDIVAMPFLFLSLHIAYGAGYLVGIFTNTSLEE